MIKIYTPKTCYCRLCKYYLKHVYFFYTEFCYIILNTEFFIFSSKNPDIIIGILSAYTLILFSVMLREKFKKLCDIFNTSATTAVKLIKIIEILFSSFHETFSS